MAAENPFDVLHISLNDCFGSSKYSDLVIRCEAQEFKVHKIVVCGQSKYFSSICDGDWKEAADGIIELKEDNVRAIEAMLRFLYTFDYDGSGNDQERISPMLFNVEVYGTAEKYDILALKLRAKDKFDKAVRTCWDMDDFAHCITDLYSSIPSTDRGLRDTVVEVAHEHISALLEKDDFRGVLEETAGFTADVLQLMAQSDNWSPKEDNCPSCGNLWKAVLPSASKYYCIRCGHGGTHWDNYVAK